MKNRYRTLITRALLKTNTFIKLRNRVCKPIIRQLDVPNLIKKILSFGNAETVGITLQSEDFEKGVNIVDRIGMLSVRNFY